MTSRGPLAIFGASGFGREVADVALASGVFEIVFLDINPPGDSVLGFPVVHESEAEAFAAKGFSFALGVGNNRTRQKIYERFAQASFPALIHPSATFGHRQREAVEKTPGVVVAAGARFMNSIEVGVGSVFSLNTTIGHDSVVDPFVAVMPGATVSGNVHLGTRAYVGTGANILQGGGLNDKLRIHADAVIGAGAVVTKPVPEGTTVVGVPARPLG